MDVILSSPVMWVLIFTSVIALAIIIERFYVLQRVNSGGDAFTFKVTQMLGKFPSDDRIEAARAFCEQERATNLSARVIESLLAQSRKDPGDLDRLYSRERDKCLPFLERRLTALSTISAISPLLGLLGTVIGMIKSFVVISQGNLEGSSLAGGISEALVTTALGLVIAIPCIISYNYFLRKVEHFIHDVEISASEVLAVIKR